LNPPLGCARVCRFLRSAWRVPHMNQESLERLLFQAAGAASPPTMVKSWSASRPSHIVPGPNGDACVEVKGKKYRTSSRRFSAAKAVRRNAAGARTCATTPLSLFSTPSMAASNRSFSPTAPSWKSTFRRGRGMADTASDGQRRPGDALCCQAPTSPARAMTSIWTCRSP
jgi:hypothetical protein